MVEQVDEHRRRQDQDRHERTVLHEAEGLQRAGLIEHNGHASHKQCTHTQTSSNDEQVVGDCEGRDHTVEAERSVQNFEVDERAQTTRDPRCFGSLQALVQLLDQHLDDVDGVEHEHADDGRQEELFRTSDLIDHGGEAQGDGSFHSFHSIQLDLGAQCTQPLERLLERRDPVIVFLVVDEEGQGNHQQEGTTEAMYGVSRLFDQCSELVTIVGSEGQGFRDGQITDDRDDQQRQEETHAKHSDGDTDREEHLSPEGIHSMQVRGVDHRVVEANRNFDNRQRCCQIQDGDRRRDASLVANGQEQGREHSERCNGRELEVLEVLHVECPL